ncbi:hypothetical protein RHGRI_029648 [Rhododendron griersonianum]|uniref:Uncharacterized protein n=1 Tax=Rhododendron griersonianum TaxID=479676 RepID=A0AAV6IQK9_9ERIC|nr:hypothetical protein RHGRI_029648 [Rhododendron griersonianum]
MERSENSDRSESAEPILPRTHRDITTNQINHHHNNPPNSFPSSSRRPRWPTVDGSLGLSEEESTAYARRIRFGIDNSILVSTAFETTAFTFRREKKNVVGSAIGFTVFAAILSSWALTFSIGGERLFGHVWDDLLMYNVAERFGLTGWI